MFTVCVSYTLENDPTFATDAFEKGDCVINISYFKLEEQDLEGGFDSYSLVEGKTNERMIHVSSLIRLKGLKFSQGPGGPQVREMRSVVTKLYYLGRDAHNSAESCCYE